MGDSAFEICTERKDTKYGHEISCRKGLWSVCSKNKHQAIMEATHYFLQYHADGEYDEMLKAREA